MLNKNVCPKCGQLYELELAACPVCGTPAQVLNDPAMQPVQRHRLSEAERRQRQQEQKRAAAEARRQEREARLAADAAEERELEAEEERLREERRRKRMERRGMTPEQIDQTIAAQNQPPQPEIWQGASAAPQQAPKKNRTPAAFSVIAILLALAALAVSASFLLWHFGMLKFPLYDKLSGTTPTQEAAEVACAGLTLNAESVDLGAEGESFAIVASVLPADCKLPVTFRSENPAVAVVGELGIVTAVAPGTTSVTVACGDQTASLTVNCTFELASTEAPSDVDLSEGLKLSANDLTFANLNENTYLTVTNLPAGTEVFWASSNEEVATVEQNGHVVAVGEGTCYITAVVNGYTDSCIVRCNFASNEG